MKNEFLQALRDLKKELDEGRLSPEQYSTRRREIHSAAEARAVSSHEGGGMC